MSMIRCPGQDTAFWDFSAIYDVKCPKCGEAVEFFKDEPARTCKKCGYEFVNPKMDFGCAAYCKYAEQCLGSLPAELIAEKEVLFKDRLAIEIKKYLGKDFKKISKILKTVKYVEQIIKEEIANPAVIIAAVYFHDITDSVEQNQNTARNILTRLNAKPEMIEEVCNLITLKKDSDDEVSINQKILLDAITLVNIEKNLKKESNKVEKLDEIIEKDLFTNTAKKIAKKSFKRC
ncbi:MAG: hypothetical protein N3A59_04290 [Thermodesulfovibrionales bacterium]|nr:hypothetical protein [Thermodesulfovibrionales bacterium]